MRLAPSFVFGPLGFITEQLAPSFVFEPLQALSSVRWNLLQSHRTASLHALSLERLTLQSSHATISLQTWIMLAGLCPRVTQAPRPQVSRTAWLCFRITQQTRCKLALRD
jgi:hypothetical protein